MIKTIFFDIDGVITNIDFATLYSVFAEKTGASLKLLTELHEDRKQLDPMLLGTVGFDAFLNLLPQTADSQVCKEVWTSTGAAVANLNTELLALIDRLRANYSLATFTNLTEGRFFIDQALGIYPHFNYTLLSCKERLMKPDEKFYQLALTRTGVMANETVFIDDKERHVAVARKLPMNGIVYKNNLQLETELENLGVIF